jgi:OmpA-OmpF porin, OOP family
VVKALVGKFAIPVAQLIAWGDGPTAPVASNKSEEGRAQKRRVELVEQ